MQNDNSNNAKQPAGCPDQLAPMTRAITQEINLAFACLRTSVRTEIAIGGFFRCKSLLVPFEDSEFATFSLTDGDIIQGCDILSMSKCAEERILQDIVLLTVT